MAGGLASMSGRQPKRLRAYCKISVNGTDVTSRFDPYLIKVRIIDKKDSSPEARIEVDDRYGRLKIPKLGEEVKIELGWRDDGMLPAFEGTIADVDHFGQKKQGRRMEWVCAGVSFLDRMTSPIRHTWDEKSPGEGMELKKVLEEAVKQSVGDGADVRIDPSFNAVKMSSFTRSGEGLTSFLKRLGGEHNFDATFAKQGGKDIISITPKDGTKSAQGQEMGTIDVIAGMWGVDANLIGWRIKPISARPDYVETASEWFDTKRAQWDSYIHKVPMGEGGWFGGGDEKRRYTDQMPNNSEQGAKGTAGTASSEAMRTRGSGWIVIDGEPRAKAGAFAMIKGIRSGVDGKYKIEECEHTYLKSGGFTTRCDLVEGSPGGTPNDDWNKRSGPAQSGSAAGGGVLGVGGSLLTEPGP